MSACARSSSKIHDSFLSWNANDQMKKSKTSKFGNSDFQISKFHGNFMKFPVRFTLGEAKSLQTGLTTCVATSVALVVGLVPWSR